MKSKNIIKKAEKLGYKTDVASWCYWDNCDVIIRENGSRLIIADFGKSYPGQTSINTEFKFQDVLDALENVNDFKDMREYREYWEI